MFYFKAQYIVIINMYQGNNFIIIFDSLIPFITIQIEQEHHSISIKGDIFLGFIAGFICYNKPSFRVYPSVKTYEVYRQRSHVYTHHESPCNCFPLQAEISCLYPPQVPLYVIVSLCRQRSHVYTHHGSPVRN